MSALMTSMCVYRNIRHVVGVLGCQRRLVTCSKNHKHFVIAHNSLPSENLVLLSQIVGRQFNSQTSSRKPDATGVAEKVFQAQSDKQTNQEQEQTNSNDSKDSKDAKKKAWKEYFIKHGYKFLLASMCVSSVIVVMDFGAPPKDAEGREMKDEFSELYTIEAYLRRSYRELFHQVEVTRQPSRQKLLPEPLKYPYIQPKYTVVMEMTDVLVHPEWSYETGWRFRKRPGIDHFLKAIGPPNFELVIYTKEQGYTADPIVNKIDPENYIMYKLYRDATRYEEGVHQKDLNCLNRDLSKVIFLDWNKQACPRNQDNLFLMDRWQGNEQDTVLGELASFILAISQSNVDDVRPVLKYYGEFDEPLKKFEENRRLQLEEQEKQKQAMKQTADKSLTRRFTKYF